MGNIAFLTLFFLFGRHNCLDRTVRFNLTNLIQMWRQTLNRTHFVESILVLCTDRDGLQSFSPLIDERGFGIRSSLHCEIGEFFK
ncbi:hypothetical protein T08_15735 [Trichinella sp. T8]|nr:hypothetical protein T08_15735 [Trichinella sp. T8]